MGCVDGLGGGAIQLYRGEGMLGEGAGLYDQRAAFGSHVDQLDAGLVRLQVVDQGGHVGRQTGAAGVGAWRDRYGAAMQREGLDSVMLLASADLVDLSGAGIAPRE